MGLTIVPASPDNEAIRELRDSSKRLEKLMEKLSASTEQLSKSSERLEDFTGTLIIVTLFLALIAVIELVKDFIPKFVVPMLGFGFLTAILSLMYIFPKIIKKMNPKK